jgi:hypothetical protein
MAPLLSQEGEEKPTYVGRGGRGHCGRLQYPIQFCTGKRSLTLQVARFPFLQDPFGVSVWTVQPQPLQRDSVIHVHMLKSRNDLA